MVSNEIAKYRCFLGMTQTTLAAEIGVSTNMICNYEKQGTLPRKKTRIRLAKALKTNENDLFKPFDDDQTKTKQPRGMYYGTSSRHW